jgi:mitogen-activated protein kinase 15
MDQNDELFLDMKIFAGTYGSKLFAQKPPGKLTSIDEILKDAPADAVDLVKKLLVLNPLKRLTAAEALQHQYVAK